MTTPPLRTARLRRRTEHRLLSGVAGGIADRLNAPAGFIRVFLFIASVRAPWIIGLYAVATVLVPARGRDRPDWDTVVSLARLGVLLGLERLFQVGAPYLNHPVGGPAGWWIAYYAVVVAGTAVLLTADYRRTRPRTARAARAAVLAAVPVAVVAAVLVGGIVLVPDLRWERCVAAVPLVGAVALVAGGRRREFVAPALVGLGVSALLVSADARLQGGVGDLRLAPRAPKGETIVARRAVGSVEIDVRGLVHSREPVVIDASVGVGDLELVLPGGSPLELSMRVGKGRIDGPVTDDRYLGLQGFDQRLVRGYRPERDSTLGPVIRVRADVGLGTVRLRRLQVRARGGGLP